MSTRTRIGFVGIGIMGKGMLTNLAQKLPASVELLVWNRSTAVSQEMASAFPGKIEVAESPADVVQKCDLTWSMLSTMEASESVFDREGDGVIAGISDGKIVVDCATLSPERMCKINKEITAKGGHFLEAPVSGSKMPAATGQLIFLCGGDEGVYNLEYVQAGFKAMGKADYFLGKVGRGSQMKLCVNSLMGTMLNAFTESMQLAEATDLPQDTLIEVLGLGAMANPMFKMKGDNIVAGKYDAHFPLKHAQKDMRLALEMAKDADLSLPVMEASNTSFESVLAAHGDEDFSAIMKAKK